MLYGRIDIGKQHYKEEVTVTLDNVCIVKLPAHRAGLPGKEIFIYIVPLDPAYKAGLAGHLPVKS